MVPFGLKPDRLFYLCLENIPAEHIIEYTLQINHQEQHTLVCLNILFRVKEILLLEKKTIPRDFCFWQFQSNSYKTPNELWTIETTETSINFFEYYENNFIQFF